MGGGEGVVGLWVLARLVGDGGWKLKACAWVSALLEFRSSFAT